MLTILPDGTLNGNPRAKIIVIWIISFVNAVVVTAIEKIDNLIDVE